MLNIGKDRKLIINILLFLPFVALAESDIETQDSADDALNGPAWFQKAVSERKNERYDDARKALEGDARYDALISEMSVKAYPCEHDEAFKAFDFWIGEWDVHVAGGALAGRNVIARAERGCLLTETWSSVSGGTGSSINYVDKITGEWVQVWNSASGSQINIRGGMTDGGMLLQGTIHYVSNGTTAPFRGLWTPMPDGRVRQFFEQLSNDGATWTSWFEGFYTRRRAD